MSLPHEPHAPTGLPSAWVERFAQLIPSGEVLDLACGGGRHTRLLIGLGHAVLAVDRDSHLLQELRDPRVETLQMDLESGADEHRMPFQPARFSGIVVTNYLHRPLLPRLFAALGAGGVLIYETFAVGNDHFGKPSNPLFLLNRGELLDVVRAQSDPGLHVLAYEDGYTDSPRPAVVQRICVVRARQASDWNCWRLP